jgi:hypothetical protein
MAKTRRPKTAKKVRRTPKSRHDQVTRYEYSALRLQLASLEGKIDRNRTDLDIQFRRIAQMQDEIEILKRAQAASVSAPMPSDSPLISLPKPTIES